MNKFSLDLSAYIAKAKGDVDTVVKTVVMDVARRLIYSSPVGDPSYWQDLPPKGYVGGTFRANWQMGINVSQSGTFDETDAKGTVSEDRIRAVLSSVSGAESGNRFVITNNLPYAQRLEDGWSRQAPVGMVMKTVIEWRNIVDDAVNGIREGGGNMNAGFGAYPL